MGNDNHYLDGIILMGSFGSGKSYLGNRLKAKGIANYTELEPIIYELYDGGTEFDLGRATKFIRAHYYDVLGDNQELAALESTGVVQRPLLLEVLGRFKVALVRVCTPKELCLERIKVRNQGNKRPLDLLKAAEFFDYWHNEIAPTYHFALDVDGTDEHAAIQDIQQLIKQQAAV